MRRLVFLVGAVALAESVFFSALAPLLPHYARALGLSKFEAGVLVGCYAAGGLVGALPGGFLASWLGVKVTMLAGLGLLAALSVVFGFAGSVSLLDLARAGQGVGAALAWTGALAWLVQVAPRGRRGELIGLTTAAGTAGTLFGPVVGAAASVAGTKPVFATVALLALTLGLWAWRVPGPARPAARQSFRLLLPALRRPGLSAGLWLLALPNLMFGLLGVLAPLRLGRLGVSGSSIGAIFLLAAAFEVVASVLVGRWADRRGRRAPLRACLLASLATTLLLPLGTSRWSLGLLVVLAGTAYGALFVPAMALLADQVELAGLEQALGFALVNLAWAPGLLIGSSAGGALAGAVGDTAPYLILVLLGAGTLTAVTRVP